MTAPMMVGLNLWYRFRLVLGFRRGSTYIRGFASIVEPLSRDCVFCCIEANSRS